MEDPGRETDDPGRDPGDPERADMPDSESTREADDVVLDLPFWSCNAVSLGTANRAAADTDPDSLLEDFRVREVLDTVLARRGTSVSTSLISLVMRFDLVPGAEIFATGAAFAFGEAESRVWGVCSLSLTPLIGGIAVAFAVVLSFFAPPLIAARLSICTKRQLCQYVRITHPAIGTYQIYHHRQHHCCCPTDP